VRIAIHDYSGHPFQIQLSRELAFQGHDVLHLFFESFQTPKGAVHKREGDSVSLEIEGIRFEEPFAKYNNFLKRRRQEIHYGKIAARKIAEYQPEVLLSANTPLDAQNIIKSTAERHGMKFVFWLQDIYSLGIDTFLRKKKYPLAGLVGIRYKRLEKRMLRSSDAVIMISPDFAPLLKRWGVNSHRMHTIENWASPDEISPRPLENRWSREQGLTGKFVFLYSGTIGMKHNPKLLVDLAWSMRDKPDVAVVVISEGINAEWIRAQVAIRGIRNLKLLPLQPYERMGEVLSAGSVLTALLSADSGEFSVPSKVLSYLCVGRPLLLSVPARNLAARIVRGNSEADASGLVTAPEDSAAFIAAAERLYRDELLRDRCGSNGLAYANGNFDIGRIVQRFNRVFDSIGVPSDASQAEFKTLQQTS
jgi:colanic acid biosynthesis glycosyl transferase WcaI